jgi:hypothetical protein
MTGNKRLTTEASELGIGKYALMMPALSKDRARSVAERRENNNGIINL